MSRPVADDGTSVTLDLHGVTVAEAERRVRNTISLAARLGRTSVRVIHGSSTSDQRARNRTIKHMLDELVAAGALAQVTGSYTTGEVTLLSLPIGAPRDRRRITLADVL